MVRSRVFTLLLAAMILSRVLDVTGYCDERSEVELLLAETYLAGAEHEKAIEAYSVIVRKQPDNIKARITLAELLSWTKKYDLAIAEYREALERDPGNTAVLKKMGEVFFWKGDLKGAEECYRELITLGGKDESVLLDLSEMLIWRKKYDEAKSFIDEAERSGPTPRSSILRAKAELYSGDYDAAEKVLVNLISEHPGEASDPEARVMLADTYAYSKKFGEAEQLYGEILRKNPDIAVKEKLADVLSWDKKYPEALSFYDEILSEKYDTKVHRQKARVLGWARRYAEAIKEYSEISEITPERKFFLEGEAKKANWTGRTAKAIEMYNELLKEEPDNLEAMFDLAQVYAYRSMWEESIEQYDRILETNPTHFRAAEGREKSGLISRHVSFSPEYRYFEADSPGREMDMRVHEFTSSARIPLNSKLFADVEYALRGRTYRDFRDTAENEGKIKIAYLEGPEWSIGGYYGLVGYSGGIDEFTHLAGGNFSHRIFDVGELGFTYDRERLENNSEVIRRHFTRNKFRNSAYFDVTSRLKAGAEYMFAGYSDGNFLQEPSLDILYNITLQPRNLSVRYRYIYREFKDKAVEYFSPKGFSTNIFTLNWRHFLNKEEIFFGADDIYYDLKYELAVDSQYIAGHKFSWEANWDITKRLNLNVKGSVLGSSCGVYEESELVVSLKYYI